MSIFEVLMMVCFGAAWPPSLYKSYTARTARGKSLFFLIIVLVGYLSGIMHKFFFSMDWVICLYALNAAMVFTDILLYFRNAALDSSSGLA